MELGQPTVRLNRVKRIAAVAALVVVVAACGPSHDKASPPVSTPTTNRSLATPSPSIGRVIATAVTYRSGLMRLDPSDGAKATVSATDALTVAGGAQPSDVPQVLLGRFTVFDYGRGLHRFIDHRFVWLVVYPHHDVMSRGPCRAPKGCGPQYGMWFVPVDARTGVVLGTWGSTA